MAPNKMLVRTARKLIACKSIAINPSNHHSAWTADRIVKSPHKDIEIPNKTIPEHIWENLERWSDKPAMVCGLTNKTYSYHQLYKYSRNFAAKLRTKLNIRDGDVICVMMPNCPEYPVALLGALEAGAEVSTANPIYTAHEMERHITLSDAKILIGVPETIPVLKKAAELAKKKLPIVAVKGTGSLPEGMISFDDFALADNVDYSVLKDVRRNPDDVALLPYSSGTTGLPKGVELTHRNITVNFVQQDVDTVRIYNETTKSHQDTTLAVIPFFHSYGLFIVMLHKLSVGFKLVTLPKFKPDTFTEAMKQNKINLFCAAPPLVLFLGSYPGITGEHLRSLNTITSGGAPTPTSDIMKVFSKVKHNMDFLQVYGLTEISPLATITTPGSTSYTTVGHGISNTELRIVDSELRPLGPNEVGELLIRGPQVMKGYRNNLEATKAAITEDNWLRSGDLAKIDGNGVVTIVDRLKELIKVKGYQVAPAELENVIKEHPDVLDAGVVGVPDARLGETPKAFVVIREGHRTDDKSIISFVSERVAEYKRVKEVKFIDALPRNPSGKILRRILREQYC